MIEPGDGPRLMTLDDAARALAISRRSLDRLVASGQLRAVHLSPRVIRIEVDEVDRFLRDRRRRDGTEPG